MINSVDERLKSYIEKAIYSDTVSQAYIFEGSDKAGQMELTEYLAGALFCASEDHPRPCGFCHACTLLLSGSHPDFIKISHENTKTISVKDIREQLLDDIDIRPFYGGRKIYIIPDAELMTKEGQNALLKTIEEPPSYAIIILLVTNRELLLETIRSRCVTLSFRAEPIFHTDDEEVKELFLRIDSILSGSGRIDTGELMNFAKELSSDHAQVLPDIFCYIERICADALLAKSDIVLTEKTVTGYIEKTAAIPYEGLERILKSVKTARHDILLNVASETVVDSLLLSIKQAVTSVS